MNRRRALSILCGAAAIRPAFAAGLGRLLQPGACAVLVDLASGRTLASAPPDTAARLRVPPGSTVKPLVLRALLSRGKLTDRDGMLCPRRLRIGTRVFDCAHPAVDAPLHVDTALAYSCNCFTAHFAVRFRPNELARELQAAGLASARAAADEDGVRLQALGERLLTTPLELAQAYRRLAADIAPCIQQGLEGAVDYGTAQHAKVPGLAVAGKTGSTRNAAGEPIAWFAGFAHARAAGIALSVMCRGRSGGADAAPLAARIFEAWHVGRL